MTRYRDGPEPFLEVEIRTGRRKGIRCADDQSSQDTVALKSFQPKGKGWFGQTLQEKKKKERSPEDLRLVLSRPSS